MKTITQIKKHFSNEEIKILVEIIRGKQDFDVMEDAIKDFYSDELSIFSFDGSNILHEDLREQLLDKLEFDLEVGGVIWKKK